MVLVSGVRTRPGLLLRWLRLILSLPIVLSWSPPRGGWFWRKPGGGRCSRAISPGSNYIGCWFEDALFFRCSIATPSAGRLHLARCAVMAQRRAGYRLSLIHIS